MLGIEFLGIKDTWVLAAYLLCIASTVLCVIFGIATRRRGEDVPRREDARWAVEEKKLEQEEEV